MTQIGMDNSVDSNWYAKHSNGKHITVKSFLISRLGHDCGDRLYKELVEFAANATRSMPGSPALLLDEAGGPVIVIK